MGNTVLKGQTYGRKVIPDLNYQIIIKKKLNEKKAMIKRFSICKTK